MLSRNRMDRLKSSPSDGGHFFTSAVQKPTALPADGYGLIFYGLHALLLLTTADGVYASVVHGFFSMLLKARIPAARIRFAASAGEQETAASRCGSRMVSFFKIFSLVNRLLVLQTGMAADRKAAKSELGWSSLFVVFEVG